MLLWLTRIDLQSSNIIEIDENFSEGQCVQNLKVFILYFVLTTDLLHPDCSGLGTSIGDI